MPKVSVVIPVYNTAPYLRQCLNSIINQTLRDIEVILVNDGSTDDSLIILEEYASKDNRVKIITQENKGAGTARNAGLCVAQGKYLSFLDSDDFFELEMMEKLYNRCEETDADIVLYKAKLYNDQTGKIMGDLGWTTLAGIPDKPLFSYKDVPKFYQCCSSVAWDKFFRKSFVDKNMISFQEIRFCNDVFFVHTLLCLTEKITALNEYFVTYRWSMSTSISATSIKDPLCFYQSIAATLKKLQEHKDYELVEQSYINWAIAFSFFHLLGRKNGNYYAFSTLYNALRDYMFEELGVKQRSKDFFYYEPFFFQIQTIINTPLEEYLFNSVLERNRLQGVKEELTAIRASFSFRLGRKLTWFPRKLRGGFRCLKEHGLMYTLKHFAKKCLRKV